MSAGTASGRILWTPEEVGFVREHYLTKGSAWIAAQLGRTAMATEKKAGDLGVRRDKAGPVYLAFLAALRADLAAHGSVSVTRVAAAMRRPAWAASQHYARARRRGDMPDVPAEKLQPPAGPPPPPESPEEYRRGVEGRIEAARSAKEDAGERCWGRPEGWLPPGAGRNACVVGRGANDRFRELDTGRADHAGW
jgi:hypothetical protein